MNHSNKVPPMRAVVPLTPILETNSPFDTEQKSPMEDQTVVTT